MLGTLTLWYGIPLMCFLCCTGSVVSSPTEIVLKQENEECNWLLLGMNSKFVARMHSGSNSESGKITLDGSSFSSSAGKYDQTLLRQNSGCVIGISKMSQVVKYS